MKKINIRFLKAPRYLTHIAAFLLGVILTAYFDYKVEDYYNRPIISCDFDCINIYDNEENNLILDLYAQFENAGQIQTTISLNVLRFQLFKINKNPYYYKLDKKIEIPGLSVISDTIRVILPDRFDSIIDIPALQKLEVEYHEIKRSIRQKVTMDSSNVVWSFMVGKEIITKSDTNLINSGFILQGDSVQIIGRKIPVEYFGKTYTCEIYPRDAFISYKIENDKIHFVYGKKYPEGFLSEEGFEMLLEPLILRVPQEIADKCVLPKGYHLSFIHETETENGVEVKNYDVLVNNMRDNRKQIVYFLK